MPFKGMNAYITGAAKGIGLETMRALLKQNLKAVLFTDTNGEEGEKVEKCLNQEFGKGRVTFYEADSSIEECILKALCRTISKYCTLDIVFNNAGIIDEDDPSKVIDVNYVSNARYSVFGSLRVAKKRKHWRSVASGQMALVRGVVLGTRIAMTEFLPRYKTIPCGIILNNASIVGLNPFQEIAAYSTTKTAVVAFTRAVGTESYLDKYSSICCAVCPGLTETAILSKGPNDFDELVASNEKQTAAVCGEHCACICREVKNGSIWVSENNKLYQVRMPDRRCLRETFP